MTVFKVGCSDQSVRKSHLETLHWFYYCCQLRNYLIDFKICQTNGILVSQCTSMEFTRVMAVPTSFKFPRPIFQNVLVHLVIHEHVLRASWLVVLLHRQIQEPEFIRVYLLYVLWGLPSSGSLDICALATVQEICVMILHSSTSVKVSEFLIIMTE